MFICITPLQVLDPPEDVAIDDEAHDGETPESDDAPVELLSYVTTYPVGVFVAIDTARVSRVVPIAERVVRLDTPEECYLVRGTSALWADILNAPEQADRAVSAYEASLLDAEAVS